MSAPMRVFCTSKLGVTREQQMHTVGGNTFFEGGNPGETYEIRFKPPDAQPTGVPKMYLMMIDDMKTIWHHVDNDGCVHFKGVHSLDGEDRTVYQPFKFAETKITGDGFAGSCKWDIYECTYRKVDRSGDSRDKKGFVAPETRAYETAFMDGCAVKVCTTLGEVEEAPGSMTSDLEIVPNSLKHLCYAKYSTKEGINTMIETLKRKKATEDGAKVKKEGAKFKKAKSEKPESAPGSSEEDPIVI